MRDDELLAAMWRAFQAAEHVGHPDGPMAAILAVVRAHESAELAALRADRDSWAEQASDRLKDWDEIRQQCEALRAERDALRAEVELWKERAYQLSHA